MWRHAIAGNSCSAKCIPASCRGPGPPEQNRRFTTILPPLHYPTEIKGCPTAAASLCLESSPVSGLVRNSRAVPVRAPDDSGLQATMQGSQLVYVPPPKTTKNLRACLTCKLIKSPADVSWANACRRLTVVHTHPVPRRSSRADSATTACLRAATTHKKKASGRIGCSRTRPLSLMGA